MKHKYLIFSVALCLITALNAKLNSQTIPSFYGAKTPASSYSVSQDARLKASADINNDGNLDLIGWDANYIKILYLDGAGTFIGDTLYLASLNTLIDCDTADINRDGYEDIVGISNGSSLPTQQIFILMSDSLGRFTVTYTGDAGGQQATELTLGDFDHDGFIDAAVAAGITASVSVLYGDSTFAFQPVVPVNTGTSSWMYYITSGDFNNDTLVDIAVSFQAGNRYTVLLSTTTQGVFQVTNYNPGQPTHGIACADFNQDGNLELALAYYGPSGTNGVQIILGGGNGAFPWSGATFYPNGGANRGVGPIYVPDLDNDGFPDIVLPGDNVAHNVLLNTGTGAMTYVQRAAGGYDPVYADFNNDGYTDMVSNSSGSGARRYCFANGDGSGILPLSPRYTGDQGYYVKAADFDNDGFGDVLSHDPTTGALSVNRGTAAGGLTPVWSTTSAQGANITIADFDGDGFKDFATYRQGMPDVKVFTGNGLGGFLSPVSYTATGSGTNGWIASGDMNDDGLTDIVYGYGTSSICTYGIMLNDGQGGFFSPQTASVNSSFGFDMIEVGLLNADNIFDIVIHHNSMKISVLYGTGSATYAAAQVYNTAHNGCMQIVITHMDYDIYPDICLNTTSGIDVLYGNSLNTFPSVTSYGGSNSICRTVVCADFNGDWLTDYATVSATSGLFHVFIGDGNRNFADPDTMYVAGSATPLDVCAADIDNDGRLDLVDNRLVVLRNMTPGIIITSVASGTPGSAFNVFPNPATDQVSITMSAAEDGIGIIRIYSLNGALVKDQQVDVAPGENVFVMQVGILEAGVYLLEVVIEQKHVNSKIVKQ